MSNTTALATRQQLNPTIWDTIQAVAPVMKDSRLFGVSTEAQAAAIMAKGFELGLTLTASFEFITVIQGKPTLAPRGALALVQQSGLLEAMKIEETKDAKGAPAACTVYMKRKGGFEYTASFSMEDAKRAGLVKSGGAWESYPANMLRWRAVGYAIDMVFPDVVGGMKRADEFGAAVDTSGNVIDGEWKAAPTMTMTQQQPDGDEEITQPPAITLQELVAEYGPEAVMGANGGRIPGTQDEIDLVAAALGA